MEVINIDDSDDEGSSSNNNNNIPSSRPAAVAANNNNLNDVDAHEYKIMLLMDHREFGQRTRETSNYLHEVESRVNKYFEGTVCEIVSLKAADYMFVARKISRVTGQVVDQRLFDLIIERKDVGDLASCLINKSKNYKPLSFFEAQMHKLVHCGIARKIFLIEGDEDTHQWLTEGGGPASEEEKRKRRLRIKTTRLLVENGRFKGVELVCTKFKDRTIAFLIYQMELLQRSFHPKDFGSMKTMQQFTDHIKDQMNDPTFQKYLALRNQPRVGDKKAMKVIRDPNENWDKSFVSPSEKSEDIKSTGNERPTYWTRSKAIRQENNAATAAAAAAPRPPPAAAAAAAAVNEQSSTTTSNSRSSTIDRSVSTVSSGSSSGATSNGSPNGASSSATASSAASGNGSDRANAKITDDDSQGKKRSAEKKPSYKKRQKTKEKVYIRHNPSNMKPSHSTPKESVSFIQNGYISANPLHCESRNSSLVALLDKQKPANGKGDGVRSRQSCAVQSGTKSDGEDSEYKYMLEFSEDDIEGQVVAVPTPKSSQNTKSDVESAAPTGNDARKKDSGLTSNSASKRSWHDDYKDVLESSDDDDSVDSDKKGWQTVGKSKEGGAKEASGRDVIDLIDDDDDDSVIVVE